MKQFTFENFYKRSLGVTLEESEKFAENYEQFPYYGMDKLRQDLENYTAYALGPFADGQLKSAIIKNFEVDKDLAKCEVEIIHYRTKAKITVEIDPVWIEDLQKQNEELDNSDDVPESDDDAGCCC